MMDADYWKARCMAAEEALRRARGSLIVTQQRQRVLDVLGGLKTAETLSTDEVAAALEVPAHQAFALLAGLHGIGFVDRERGRAGADGVPSRWKLAHLVQVGEPQE